MGKMVDYKDIIKDIKKEDFFSTDEDLGQMYMLKNNHFKWLILSSLKEREDGKELFDDAKVVPVIFNRSFTRYKDIRTGKVYDMDYPALYPMICSGATSSSEVATFLGNMGIDDSTANEKYIIKDCIQGCPSTHVYNKVFKNLFSDYKIFKYNTVKTGYDAYCEVFDWENFLKELQLRTFLLERKDVYISSINGETRFNNFAQGAEKIYKKSSALVNKLIEGKNKAIISTDKADKVAEYAEIILSDFNFYVWKNYKKSKDKFTDLDLGMDF